MTTTTLETPRAVWRRPKLIVLTAVAGIMAAASGAFIVHEAKCKEDSCVVWVCAWMGNRMCGPDTPAVIFSNPFVER